MMVMVALAALSSASTSNGLAFATSPCMARMLAGGVRAKRPMRFPLSRGSDRLSMPARLASLLAVNQHIGRVVIGVGVLDQTGALGITHDEIAGLASHRVRHVAGRLGEPGIFERRVQLLCDQLGELVLEPLGLLVRERHVVGVGANAQRRRAGRTRAGACKAEQEGEADLAGAPRPSPQSVYRRSFTQNSPLVGHAWESSIIA